jgi:nucleoside-diphosphate-sugar epimerase
MVNTCLNLNYKVRAGVHNIKKINNMQESPDFEMIKIDICKKDTLKNIFKGVDILCHFAACVNSKASSEKLYHINVEGTRNIWETGLQEGVTKFLYCSTTAVYGLLSKNGESITEKVPGRALEPYGKSKLEGEKIVQKISITKGINSIIIRPVAVFGPGEHTPFGIELRNAAFSKLLLAGGFQNKKFSFVHVQDVVKAAIHLMQDENNYGQIFNIAVEKPIHYNDAFQAYLNALNGFGYEYMKLKLLGKISVIADKTPGITHLFNSKSLKPFVFKIWRPGFDMTYSSKKLLDTSYQFQYSNFEDVISSCINGT